MIYLIQPVATTKILYVPNGSATKIITYLQERGLNLVPSVDRYLIRFFGQPQSGWIDIGSTKLSLADFFHRLTTAKAALTPLTLIPGDTTEIFFQKVANDFGLDKKRLDEAYSKYADVPEGLLFPETYMLPIGINENDLVYYLVTISKNAHVDMFKKIFGEFNEKRWQYYLIIGSIIQKEAANNAEMPLISSVIYNRLKKGMKLQMDGTLNYGVYSNQKVTPERIRNDRSKYNTYIHNGIPHQPVSTVSKEALRAAIFPTTSDYLYFVRNKNGVHTFSKTYQEHIKAFNN